MAKVRGRKIKRARNLYKKKKSGFRKTLETVIFAIVAAGLCFVGYAAGKPLLSFFAGNTNPAQTDDIPASASGGETDASETTTAAPDTEVTTTAAPVPRGVAYAVYAPSNVLTNTAALSAFLETAKSNGNGAVVLEMKDSEGRLLYKSDIEVLQGLEEINTGVLTAAQIASLCENAGVKPIARINTLMDRIAPSKLKDVSYRFASGGTAWLDNRPEDGGKLWANPFLPGTVSYVRELTCELYDAGFGDIIFASLTFPGIREYDASVLPPEVSDEKKRCEALAGLVASASEARPNANIMTEMSLADVTANNGPVKTAEILRSKAAFGDALIVAGAGIAESGGEASVTSDLSSLVKKAYAKAEKIVGSKIIPCVDGTDLSDADREKIVSALASAGYPEYMSRN